MPAYVVMGLSGPSISAPLKKLAISKQKPRPTEGKMFPIGLPKVAS